MSTFTLQELNLPMTAEDALKAIEVVEEYKKLGQTIADNTRLEAQAGTLDAPEPQPTLTDVINNICTQLQLLATVISQSKAQPEGENSLQECVALTLQQADWFHDLIRHELVALDIAEIAKDAVQEVVESEVDGYFENCFDVSNHFDFDDAVHDAVGDRIDDVVSDKIDDAVDAYLSNATISISK